MPKEKQEKIIDAVCDAILVAAENYKKGEAIDIDGLHALHDSVRILHHVKKIEE